MDIKRHTLELRSDEVRTVLDGLGASYLKMSDKRRKFRPSERAMALSEIVMVAKRVAEQAGIPDETDKGKKRWWALT